MTINWDLANKGLYQLSMSTRDGKPNWYVDLRSMATQTFASAQPSITFSGTGFPGLDGNYYAAIDNGNLVLVEKSGAYTIYFSTSAIAPVCTKSAEGELAIVNEVNKENITVYPNPSPDGNFMLRIYTLKEADITVTIFNQVGQKILNKVLGKYSAGSHEIQLQTGMLSGMYLMEVKAGNILKHAKIEIW
jgi:hypothetical protein